MLNVVRNTPSLLIPKELFVEEKIQEYWSVLHSGSSLKNIGKDDLQNFYLLYIKPNESEAIHEITVLYKEFLEKFPNDAHAICINVYKEGFNLCVLKNRNIEYTGYFRYAVKEDILYQLANISQHFFEDILQIIFVYQQLSPTILRLLSNYYEMKKI